LGKDVGGGGHVNKEICSPNLSAIKIPSIPELSA